MGKEFDPKKFIDRDNEQKKFITMLDLTDDARILVIKDDEDTGKTHLLLKLAHLCRQRHQPFCLFSFDEHKSLLQPGDRAPIAFLKLIYQQLVSKNIRLNDFEGKTMAMEGGNRLAFDKQLMQFIKADGEVKLGDDNIHDVKGNVEVTAVKVDVSLPRGPDLGFDPLVREIVISSFFSDFEAHCEGNTLVVLLDAYEQAVPEVAEFIADKFFDRMFFGPNHRARKLLLVIAGRTAPDFSYYLDADVERVVGQPQQLGSWGPEHLREYMSVNNLKSDEEIFAIGTKLLSRKYPVGYVTRLIDVSRGQNLGGSI